jgi:hypothetical protein
LLSVDGADLRRLNWLQTGLFGMPAVSQGMTKLAVFQLYFVIAGLGRAIDAAARRPNRSIFI